MVEAHYGATNIGALIGFSYEPVNTDWMETHGARIKTLRKERKLTQEDLAELAKVDQSTLSGIEKHNAMPSGETLIRLCEALCVSAEYVMRGRSATWPFRVKMGRFLALNNEDRAYVEGKLEAAIESRESSPANKHMLSIHTVTDQPTTATTPASATKTSAYVESLKRGKRGAQAGVKSRGASKSRGGRSS